MEYIEGGELWSTLHDSFLGHRTTVGLPLSRGRLIYMCVSVCECMLSIYIMYYAKCFVYMYCIMLQVYDVCLYYVSIYVL